MHKNKTLGQVACEAFNKNWSYEPAYDRLMWKRAAKAVEREVNRRRKKPHGKA